MGYQETIFELSASLGGEVNDLLRPSRDLSAQAERLSQELAGLRQAEERRRDELVSSVAAGKVAPAEIPKSLTYHWVVDSPASMVIVHANVATHANASRVAREAGPSIFKALQKRVAGIVAESVKLSVALPRGVDTEAKALRATRNGNGSAQVLATWERLSALIGDWVTVFDLVDAMQKCGWIPGPDSPYDKAGAVVFQRYQKPLSLPPGYWTKTPPQLRLGVAQASGAGPALIDWDTAVARFTAWDRTQRNYTSMETVTVVGPYGTETVTEQGPQTPSEFKPAGVI